MRSLASLGIAATLALAPAAATSLQPADTSSLTVSKPVTVVSKSGGATTNGWFSELNCLFFNRCN